MQLFAPRAMLKTRKVIFVHFNFMIQKLCRFNLFLRVESPITCVGKFQVRAPDASDMGAKGRVLLAPSQPIDSR